MCYLIQEQVNHLRLVKGRVDSSRNLSFLSGKETSFISFKNKERSWTIPLGSVSRALNKTSVVLNGEMTHTWEMFCVIGKKLEEKEPRKAQQHIPFCSELNQLSLLCTQPLLSLLLPGVGCTEALTVLLFSDRSLFCCGQAELGEPAGRGDREWSLRAMLVLQAALGESTACCRSVRCLTVASEGHLGPGQDSVVCDREAMCVTLCTS